MMAEIIIPDELPEKPDGWSRHLIMHFNYGQKGGAAAYSIHDANGKRLPINYQYDTRKKNANKTGFVATNGKVFVSDVYKTYAGLRRAWPKIKLKLAASV